MTCLLTFGGLPLQSAPFTNKSDIMKLASEVAKVWTKCLTMSALVSIRTQLKTSNGRVGMLEKHCKIGKNKKKRGQRAEEDEDGVAEIE